MEYHRLMDNDQAFQELKAVQAAVLTLIKKFVRRQTLVLRAMRTLRPDLVVVGETNAQLRNLSNSTNSMENDPK